MRPARRSAGFCELSSSAALCMAFFAELIFERMARTGNCFWSTRRSLMMDLTMRFESSSS